MRDWLTRIGKLLRAQHTPREGLAGINTPFLLGATAVLGGSYGLFMGAYAVRASGLDGTAQMLASIVKLPLLFLLTAAVTFPSLYVFNTLLGSKLTFEQTLRTIVGWITVVLAVAASLGPILGFFTISSDSYPFIVLLNVVLLGLAGSVGCAALVRMLRAATDPDAAAPQSPELAAATPTDTEATPEPDPDDQAPTPATPDIHSQNRRAAELYRERYKPSDSPAGNPRKDISGQTLVIWVVIFGIVGLQMAWILRPFIGAPGESFSFFRGTESNVFAAIIRVINALAGAE